jgi:hypothetical protein
VKKAASLHAANGLARPLRTEAETAAYLRMSQKWLQKKRLCGGGIPYLKIGSAIRYRMSDIEEFELKSLRNSTSDRGKR